MGFSNMGMGFLPTDPRQKKLPKGGSTHAGQYSDTSSIITGNPNDSIGFASSAARGDLFSTPYVAPEPENQDKTAEEIVDERAASGVASSHQNMGSIAVDFRASEQAKADAGEQTVRGARESKILDARAADEYKRTILDPATEEASRFRSQAAAAKDMFGTKMSSNISSYKGKTSGGLGFNVPSNRGKLSGGGGYSGNTVGGYSGSTTGPKHGGILPQAHSDFRGVRANDPTALAAQRAHAAAPGTQEQNWMDMANAQSASGKATPGEMAQAAVAMYTQKVPNK